MTHIKRSQRRRTLGRSGRDHRGLTVLELLVATGLALLVMGVLWGFMAMGRRGEKVAETDAALQVAMRVQERIERDLRGLVAPPGGTALRTPPTDGAAVGPDLAFYTFDPSRRDTLALPVIPVAYQNHDGRLYRTAGSDTRPLGVPYLRSGSFDVIDTRVGPMIVVSLSLEIEGKAQDCRFVHRLHIPSDRGDEDLQESYPFEEPMDSLAALSVPRSS